METIKKDYLSCQKYYEWQLLKNQQFRKVITHFRIIKLEIRSY